MYAWYKIILSPFFSPFFPSYTYSQLTFPLPQYFSFTSLALLILLPPFLSSIMGGFGTEVSYTVGRPPSLGFWFLQFGVNDIMTVVDLSLLWDIFFQL